MSKHVENLDDLHTVANVHLPTSALTITEEATSTTTGNDQLDLQCKNCHKWFLTKASFTYHKNRSKLTRAHPCTFCCLTYANLRTLRSHMFKCENGDIENTTKSSHSSRKTKTQTPTKGMETKTTKTIQNKIPRHKRRHQKASAEIYDDCDDFISENPTNEASANKRKQHCDLNTIPPKVAKFSTDDSTADDMIPQTVNQGNQDKSINHLDRQENIQQHLILQPNQETHQQLFAGNDMGVVDVMEPDGTSGGENLQPQTTLPHLVNNNQQLPTNLDHDENAILFLLNQDVEYEEPQHAERLEQEEGFENDTTSTTNLVEQHTTIETLFDTTSHEVDDMEPSDSNCDKNIPIETSSPKNKSSLLQREDDKSAEHPHVEEQSQQGGLGNIAVSSTKSVACEQLSSEKTVVIYNDEFVLKTWGIIQQHIPNSTKQIIQSKLKEKGDDVYDHIIRFLRGKLIRFSTVEDMLDFLYKKPQSIVGIAPISLMIFQFSINKLSHADCFRFYEDLKYSQEMEEAASVTVSTFYKLLAALVLNVAFYKVQCQLYINFPCEEVLGDIPQYLIEDTGKNNIYPILYEKKQYFLQEASSCLSELMTYIPEATLENEFSKTTRGMWLRLATKLVSCHIDNTWDDNANIFDILLIGNLNHRIGTTLYLYVKIKPHSIIKPIFLHQEVVERFVDVDSNTSKSLLDNQTEQKQPVLATTEDVRTIYMLLYVQSIHDFDLIKGKITMNVYCIAKRLGIQNMAWFLFRNHGIKTLLDNANKIDLLHVLLKIGPSQMLQDLAQLFDKIYTLQEEQSIALNGLSVEEVKMFCSLNTLRICELQKYFMLETWAKVEAKREINQQELNLDAVEEDDSIIKAKFDQVSACLRLDRLARAAYGSYAKLKYINKQALMQHSKSANNYSAATRTPMLLLVNHGK